ncbi:periphilin-1 isoform X3 [Hippocampus comes]|uniref:periphilin-1 isoform X3 n=1 Tax=Hippocampus comes TaxID=109280 RepID=UPI00094E924D|nr:PREDICTED: periphilin-1 isoform X3 [Hippocampus comes]
MTYRRERSVREVYEDRFMSDRPGRGQYSRGGERRGHFGRPDGYEYEGGPRFFPNGGGPRNYHGEDQRGYHGDVGHFPSERRGGPPSRREDYSYRGPREEQHSGRPMDYNSRAPPPPPRNQGMYPTPRSLPESGADTLVQAILNLDRGDERQDYRRKAPPFPPPRDRSPHSRSGSSVSSRSYSPDRSKSLPFPSQQGKDKIPGLSREGSPSSATSNKEESNAGEAEKEEPPPAAVVEESHKITADDYKEKRSLAIAAKAREIEKVCVRDGLVWQECHTSQPADAAATPATTHPRVYGHLTRGLSGFGERVHKGRPSCSVEKCSSSGVALSACVPPPSPSPKVHG